MTNSTSTAGHAPRHWYRWLLVTPFIWQAALAPLVNDIGYQPLGLPFPMAWQMAGIVYASLVIGLVFHLDQRAGLGDEEAGLLAATAGQERDTHDARYCLRHPVGDARGGAGLRRARENTLTEWAVGGRSLGTLIFWFMNAGEVYTTFAVLGISGYAWALGAPAYLAFCSVSLSYAVGYWLMPRIWRAGRQEGFVTQADYFAARYEAPWLGVLTGVIGIASLVIYVQIQLISLGLIVRLTLGSDLSTVAATLIAAALMIAFVFIAGLRSAAFAAGVRMC